MTRGVDHGLRDAWAIADMFDSSIAGLIDVMTKHTPHGACCAEKLALGLWQNEKCRATITIAGRRSSGSILVLAALIGMLPRINILCKQLVTSLRRAVRRLNQLWLLFSIVSLEGVVTNTGSTLGGLGVA